jgi:hypothetical protein
MSGRGPRPGSVGTPVSREILILVLPYGPLLSKERKRIYKWGGDSGEFDPEKEYDETMNSNT